MSDSVPANEEGRAPSRRRQGHPRREDRPERVVVGGETCIRNDVLAAMRGTVVRTLDRDDRIGAPFLFLAGVKYRPQERYDRWLLSRIGARRGRKPSPKRRPYKQWPP